LTLKKQRAQFQKLLSSQYTQDEIRLHFEMLCETYLGLTPAQVVLELKEPLSPEAEAQLQATLKALKENEPIQYIIGSVVFAGFRLAVDERVLIPRPETEELVHWLLSTYTDETPLRVLDIGTGSGCVAIALKKARPNWEVTAWDVDLDALTVRDKMRTHISFPLILKLSMYWVLNCLTSIGISLFQILLMCLNPKKHIRQHMFYENPSTLFLFRANRH